MVLAELSLAVRHRTPLQNRDTVLGTLFARAALGVAAQAFLLGRRRFAGGTAASIVPVPLLLCLTSRRCDRVVRARGNGLAREDSRGPVLPAYAVRSDRAVLTLPPGLHRLRFAAVAHLAREKRPQPARAQLMRMAIDAATHGARTARRAIGSTRMARAAVAPCCLVALAPAQSIAPKHLAYLRGIVSPLKDRMDERRNRTQSRRKTAGVLTLLAPSATYADHIVHPIRLAASVATSAISEEPSAGAHLTYIRRAASGALNAVIRALQTRTLTHKIITSAQQAVDEWLAGLDAV
jgi:hypothetical protein